MKLLIVTQKVNSDDPILGFFHNWIIEFSKHCSTVTVLCLEKGTYSFPHNVQVISLGKEARKSRIHYLIYFFIYIWKYRNDYDDVFVHMNPIYIVLGGWLWQCMGKKISLWYTHKHVDLKLRIAEKFAHTIFTASSESFKLKTKKCIVMGHGIDTDIFKQVPHSRNNPFLIVTAGRISPIKNYEIIIQALDQLKKGGKSIVFKVIGLPVTDLDHVYFDNLKKTIIEKYSDTVVFAGSVPNNEIAHEISQADLFINMSDTGSMDKAVLEAMACGLPVLTCNVAFKSMLSPYGLFIEKDTESIVKHIQMMYDGPIDMNKLGNSLRDIVVKDHNLSQLIVRIINKIAHD